MNAQNPGAMLPRKQPEAQKTDLELTQAALERMQRQMVTVDARTDALRGSIRELHSAKQTAELELANARLLLQRLVDLVDAGEVRDGLPLRAIARDAAELLARGAR
jgi:hypothetical protein